MKKFVCISLSLLAVGCDNWKAPDRSAKRYWETNLVIQEPVLPVAATEKPERFPLSRSPVRITRVEDLTTGKAYVAGRDYVLDRDQLVIPPGSMIRLTSPDFLHTPIPSSPLIAVSKTKDGRQLRIAEDFQTRQIAVTYEATSKPQQPAAIKPLPRYFSRLANGEKVSITLFGDSITEGASATPGKSFAHLAATHLSMRYPGQISVRNQSVGGLGSYGALDLAPGRLNDAEQDLVVLGFGMNDATNGPYAPTAKVHFKEKLEGVIRLVRKKAPETEFLLISGIRGNPEWVAMNPGMFDEYRTALLELQAEMPGISVLDVTTVWDELRKRKSFYDLTSNGVNHPGNFVHAIYADLLIQALAPSVSD